MKLYLLQTVVPSGTAFENLVAFKNLVAKKNKDYPV